jgi:predicted lipoprotein with Yx(FWY)xxD motif
MRRALAALIIGIALVGCGDDDGDSGGERATTVALDEGVLVDSHGAALYTSNMEVNGDVFCTGSCTEVWLPLTARHPTATSDVEGDLGVLTRPDGSRQVTYDGKPVYRFAEDGGPGDVTGDGVTDSFDGQEFTWNVIGEPESTSGTMGGSYGGGY